MEEAGIVPPPVLAVVGPTATGKTRFAIALAKQLDGEVVSADMGQLYRRLDAGTAKPPGRWKSDVYVVEGVPHHLIDVLEPTEPTNAAAYAALALPVLERIRKRGKRPIVAGGTGLYVKALLEGLDDLPKGSPSLRKRLLARAEREGRAALHSELSRLDPKTAARIPAGNIHRLVRALEVVELTGRPISSFWRGKSKGRAIRAEYLGLRWEPGALRERILRRTRSMFPAMVREVSRLVPSKFSGREPGFRCIGYPEALACARMSLPIEEGLERMLRATLAYAKRQRTWFRRQAPVRWVDAAPGDSLARLARRASRRLGES